ncbi:hypothetical protein KHA80_15180 [Anaerobacillus sp. HL2]|nr:hypothetical protein KHA80_15180 [Anaerobacillus sp. HL2]
MFSNVVTEMDDLKDKVSEATDFSRSLQQQSEEMSRAIEYIRYISDSLIC